MQEGETAGPMDQRHLLSLSSRCSQHLALIPLILALPTDENAAFAYAYFTFANKLQDP